LNTYTLDANVENLTFVGTGNFTGNGNSLDNIISGGAGADTLSGGAGNDVYFVGAGDVVNEQAGGGTDSIRTTLNTYTLGANVENLTFLGSGNFTGTGNALDNVISGGIGNDTLDGGAGSDILIGGLGTDTLRGGVGNDFYFVDNVPDVVVRWAKPEGHRFGQVRAPSQHARQTLRTLFRRGR
jgi:Ca2+-binding RTX toxin-like protein